MSTVIITIRLMTTGSFLTRPLQTYLHYLFTAICRTEQYVSEHIIMCSSSTAVTRPVHHPPTECLSCRGSSLTSLVARPANLSA